MMTTRGISSRIVPVMLALALFLAGSNYCLVGALAGPRSPLACGMTGGAARATCPAHAAKGSPQGRKHAAPMPCCIALAPVVAPGAAKLAPPASADAAPAVLAAGAPLAAPAIAWVGRVPCAGAGPPGGAPASSSEARAPPLA